MKKKSNDYVKNYSKQKNQEVHQMLEKIAKLMDEDTLNPTMNDICVCPYKDCDGQTYYQTDYGREFCSKCLREVRVNENFKGGKLLNTIPQETVDIEGTPT